MKKYCFVLILICILSFLLYGCDPHSNEYVGSYPQLTTVATHSMLGVSGLLDSDPYIFETDNYGRTLFVYDCPSDFFVNYNEGELPYYIFGIFICQKSDKEYTYFYPDVNMVTLKNVFSARWGSKYIEEFKRELSNGISDEELEAFKKANDWNQPIDESKCKKVKITRLREHTVSLESREKAYIEMFEPRDFKNRGQFVYVTSDDYGRHLYVIMEIADEETGAYGRPYVAIFNPDESFDKEKGFMEITDPFNYQDELKNFKDLNNWNKPILTAQNAE